VRLLVTGGAGYIGSVVAARLVEAGHETTVFDNLSKGRRRNVPEGARFVRGDLLDADRLRRLLAQGFDGVLHLAALSLVGESVEHPERYYRTNVCGTLELLDAMRVAGVPRLIFSSTAAVYGQPEHVPVPESAPARPTNPYGSSKLVVDRMISHQASAHGLAATSLRYFNVAGSSGRYGAIHESTTQLIPVVLQAAMGRRDSVRIYGSDYPTPDGTAIRDYIHVEDITQAHLLALEAAQSGTHRIYNLGNGAGFSVREVIETSRRVTGRPIKTVGGPRRPGDPAVVVASSRKIREELGWTSERPDLQTIISDTWAWLQTYSHLYESGAR
jgi:UDP-glucose 4-epimerase